MARFYGRVEGSRGAVSRLGGAASSLRTTAAGWQGAVTVCLYDKDGIDYACVKLTKWMGKGREQLIYDGPVSGSAP